MELRIALAGNPNSGKTTLFNALTGSNQFVGNWPGVTVEKKEGRLKGQEGVIVTDLPGIYSLSPYTPEEIVARKYLIEERPDVILNIVDGTNLERNLYLTTQLTEIGIPVVVAINMMDIVRKNGDSIDIEGLSRVVDSPVVEISALRGDGVEKAAAIAIEMAKKKAKPRRRYFSGIVEHALAHIEEAVVHHLPEQQQRWYAIKIFERDVRVIEKLDVSADLLTHIEKDIKTVEHEFDDDAESIIINERYNYITEALKGCYKRRRVGISTTEKIDRVVTNRFAALPIFALIMFLVYFISVSTVGTWMTDYTNDGLFGDGWYLFGIGRSAYEEALEEYVDEHLIIERAAGFVQAAEATGSDIRGLDDLKEALSAREWGAIEEAIGSYGSQIVTGIDAEGNTVTLDTWLEAELENAPVSEDFGVWVPGIPVLLGALLEKMNVSPWLYSLVIDGMVGGVGAVLGFVPQILVLFLFLAFLEACGYMSRIAFVLDRIFCKFGLSGKSFIPLLIGTGCSVPGIMASRTIENEADRRMTVITTSFVPCGAKLPVIALIAGALFGGAWWVAPVAYFVGITAVICSGLILKKTKLFAGDPAPFVMELPAYHMPTASSILRSMWDRGWAFIKKAGTIILVSTIVIWVLSHLGVVDGGFGFLLEMELEDSLLGYFGKGVKWIFAPLGFASIETAVATFMGLVAKEEIVAVLGVLDFLDMTRLAGFSFLVFNLLCAPCFAAMGAIKREMNSAKWTAFAIGYQCLFAYLVSLVIYQVGALFAADVTANAVGVAVSVLVVLLFLYLLLRPNRAARAGKGALQQ
ncbi:MAG: ferrous iron transporter B [Ruminococcaceae bacterium]|nr:ferrous iron transporter B [Oscillospiraceae bacterium]